MSWGISGRLATQAFIGLLMGLITLFMCPLRCSATLKHSRQSRSKTRIQYRVIKSFVPSGTDRFTIIIIVVDPVHFNRDHMKLLAEQLNREFPGINKLKVSLLDDERPARQLLTGALEPDAYEKLQRGLYYLDRSECVEYVRFATQENKPVKITRKCVRK